MTFFLLGLNVGLGIAVVVVLAVMWGLFVRDTDADSRRRRAAFERAWRQVVPWPIEALRRRR